jgi:peptide/nickel transport system substrate-binding protein
MPRDKRLAPLAVIAVALACARRPSAKPDEITLSVPYELDTLDPHARNRLSEFAVLSNVYEPLVTTDATMSIRPCLAERWDNPDLVTWVFHLRPGVVFQDGSPLAADDVVASFERLLGSAGTLEMSGYCWDIKAVRALDATTVEIKTLAPMSILLNKLRFVLIVPKRATAASLQEAPVGTGPYRVGSWKRGEEIRLVRNDSYWGRRPPLARAAYLLSRGPEPALEDLVAGRSQLVQCGSKKLEQSLQGVSGVSVHRQNSIFAKFLGFDFKHEATPFCSASPNPFLDHRVREAISLAIDRSALVARLSTYAVPASQAVPPFIFGYNPLVKDLPYDPVRAKQLLAQAGLADGFEVTLHSRRIFGEAPQVVGEMLAAIGIRTKMAQLPDPQFFGIVAEHGSSFYMSRFGCPTGDASDILENAVHTIDLKRHFGSSNDGEYSNKTLDSLIEESASILDMERRRPILQQAMTVTTQDLALVPLYVDQDVFAVKDSYAWTPRNDNFVLAAEVGVR